jgi:sodium-dependent dicarboxylate transporter 2/3/5
MVPLLIALAGALDIEPTLLAIPAGITSSLAFILVTSTPTNVIPYSAGYFTIKDMAKAGLLMTVVSSICVTASICIVGRLFNIVNW